MAGAVAGCVVLGGCGLREPAIEPLTSEPLQRTEIAAITGKTAIMDIIALDQATQRLYVTDGLLLGLDVIDTSRSPGRFLKTIPVGSNPNGVVVASDISKVFVGTDDSTMVVIDVNPQSPKADRRIATVQIEGKGASDLIDYDPRDHRVFLTNPDDGWVTAFDSRTYRKVATITGLGLVDQPRYDPGDGMVYVSGAERNSVIKIDPRTNQVVAEAPIPVTCEPHGLAIDPTTNLGLIGCSDKDEVRTLSWNFTTGKMVRSFDQAGAGDQVIFDAVSDHFYFAASSYSPAEVAIFQSGTAITFLTGVPTSHKSKGVAYDEAHQRIYTYDGKHREAGVWSFPDPLASGAVSMPRPMSTSSGGH
jgi:DNA-binding beta-propeller fold protein YncE